MQNIISRRDWLKLMGATALSVPAVGFPLRAEAKQDLRAQAKKNLKLSIFTGVYGGLPLAEAARRIAEDGFKGVVLQTAFADLQFDPLAPNWDALAKMTAAFKKHDLKIVGLYGYYNVVDPDAERRRRGEARMELFIQNWKRFGCRNISTETGTLNAASEWSDSPQNQTEEGFAQCRDAFARLARMAEKSGAIISIETYWKNMISSIERTERLFREVKSPALKLVMDPCNYFRKDQLPEMDVMLNQMFDRLGKQIVLAHAKDVKAAPGDDTELPAAGQGVLNYPLYLRRLAQMDREVYLTIEHLTLAEVPRTRDYVLHQFEKI